jgi:hypothetical protein
MNVCPPRSVVSTLVSVNYTRCMQLGLVLHAASLACSWSRDNQSDQSASPHLYNWLRAPMPCRLIIKIFNVRRMKSDPSLWGMKRVKATLHDSVIGMRPLSANYLRKPTKVTIIVGQTKLDPSLWRNVYRNISAKSALTLPLQVVFD